MERTADRKKLIVRTSIVGIIVNLFLVVFKAIVGMLSNSIAIILDAVNNLSDAMSSIVTIAGAYLAAKLPDKKHPMGHGRAEYLSSLVVSAIILYAGITSLIESVKKIINPEMATYTTVTFVILVVAIITKIVLGTYVSAMGKKVKSSSLAASGKDALFDAVISTGVLISAVVYFALGISLEAYVGVLIALFIIKAGYEMLTDTLDDILGRRADSELTKKIKKLLNEEPEVRGAYDLVLDNYGPEKNYASVHIELNDTMTVAEVDELTRRVEEKIYRETGVVLTGVGVYSYNTGCDETATIRNNVQEVVLKYDWALQMHGFYVNIEKKNMRFDVVMSFDVDYKEGIAALTEDVKKLYPEYEVSITPDVDMSD
ncbi:MAG: cation diffusion facilitator family transporter [Lachnospiraceae bacterium]|nr:cation diffusion facilitator family transporter [Lachnospiraceae bacterium]